MEFTVPTPDVSDGGLTGIAGWAVSRMGRVPRPFLAERVLGVVAHRERDARRKADLLAEAAQARLAQGYVPRHLRQAYAAELAWADAEFAAGRKKEAAASLTKALMLAFHRVAHLDNGASPLAEDPTAFTGPLRRSKTARALRKARGRKSPAAAPEAGRPVRLLIAHSNNANFLGPLLQRYEQDPEVELRLLNTAADPELKPLSGGVGRLVRHAVAGDGAYTRAAEAALRPHLDWADVVFVDWCTAAATLFTRVDPGTTRIVVRLHSFEALGYWPHLADFSRVDDLVFVSEHLRELCVAAMPRLAEPDGPRLHVVSNVVPLDRFALPKKPDARFTLGLVGTSQVAKDPRWALDVLKLLRRKDPRYVLHTIGSPLGAAGSAATARYHEAFLAELGPLEAEGAVRRIGQTDDVPGALQEVGVILSTSVRESWHAGLIEGAASGAVPVVRAWPSFAGKPPGARTPFPPSWIATTPAEAAERILAATGAEESWLELAQEASAHASATWDPRSPLADFDRILLGGRGEA